MSLDLTVTDLFCGAGGSSLGAERAGADVVMAANHWKVAATSYSTNHPDTRVDVADVSQVDPRRYPATDVLLASPECTHHSQARTKRHVPDLFDPTGDPAAERSRATMWDVVRFAERHRYQLVVVENVMEIMRWAPIDGWFTAMQSLGYRWRILSLNAMIAHPTPQSRDRWLCVFWREGNTAPDLEVRPPCWCPSCDELVEGVQMWKRPDRRWGKYRQQYVYRHAGCGGEVWPVIYPAASAIDWSLPCPRIGDRARPLAPATRRRVGVGLERFGPAILAQVAGHTYERPGYVRAWPVTGTVPAQTATLSHALVVDTQFSGDRGRRPVSTLQPWPAQTGRQSLALVVPMRTNGRARVAGDEPMATVTTGHGGAQTLITLPFVCELRGGHSDARGIEEPLAAVTASGNHHAVVMPPAFYVKHFGRGDDPSMAHPVTDPLGSVTGIDHHSLVALPFTVDYHGNGRASSVADPLPTQDTRDRLAVVEPSIDVDDCGFRMLEPHEIGRAQAFPDTYVVVGNKRDKVRQYGNAVPPPMMNVAVQRGLESLA